MKRFQMGGKLTIQKRLEKSDYIVSQKYYA